MSASAAAQLTADLRRRLAAGEFRPATRLVETQLASEYRVSRVPVREALGTLCAEGLLERKSTRGGVFVPMLSTADLTEIYLARGALETLLYRTAGPQLTSENIYALEDLQRDVERAAALEDLVLLSRSNRDFHMHIMRVARMPKILAIVERLWDITGSYRAYFWTESDHRAFTISGHREILDACARRDGEALVVANNRHRRELTGVQWPWIGDEAAEEKAPEEAVVEP